METYTVPVRDTMPEIRVYGILSTLVHSKKSISKILTITIFVKYILFHPLGSHGISKLLMVVVDYIMVKFSI